MKPVAFEYRRAESVQEACALLADDPGALLMAGGQTLMPMLAMRLARPTRIVDILRVPGLDGIRAVNGHVTLGATTRQATVERSATVAADLPLLFRAMPWVGHPPTRRRGTVGGSIANGDPTAEIGLVAVALDAEVMMSGAAGITETMPIAAFFVGPMMTALAAGSVVTGLRFPRRADRARVGTGFVEVSQRHGDYAMAAAAAEVALDADRACTEIHVAVGGAADTPTRLDLDALLGRKLVDSEVTDAVAAALAPLEMMEDQHTTGPYRRRAAIALAARAVIAARDDAVERADG